MSVKKKGSTREKIANALRLIKSVSGYTEVFFWRSPDVSQEFPFPPAQESRYSVRLDGNEVKIIQEVLEDDHYDPPNIQDLPEALEDHVYEAVRNNLTNALAQERRDEMSEREERKTLQRLIQKYGVPQ